MELLTSTCMNQCQLYYTLEQPSPPGALRLNVFNHLCRFQGSYVFPSPALIPLVLSEFLVKHVTSHFRLHILVAPCWMEAPWLLTVLKILEDVSHCSPIMKDLVTNVVVGQVLKDLPFLLLSLWLLRDMCCIDKGSLHQSVRC